MRVFDSELVRFYMQDRLTVLVIHRPRRRESLETLCDSMLNKPFVVTLFCRAFLHHHLIVYSLLISANSS